MTLHMGVTPCMTVLVVHRQPCDFAATGGCECECECCWAWAVHKEVLVTPAPVGLGPGVNEEHPVCAPKTVSRNLAQGTPKPGWSYRSCQQLSL